VRSGQSVQQSLSRNCVRCLVKRPRSLSSHSHTTMVLHPIRCASDWTVMSRRRLPSSLRRQKPVRDLGMVASEQPGCWCQKQPCTQITFRRPGKAMSGRPGIGLYCRRYRYPRSVSKRRSALSGPVSRCRIRDISLLRSALLRVSGHTDACARRCRCRCALRLALRTGDGAGASTWASSGWGGVN
jgi:hypothetical protein